MDPGRLQLTRESSTACGIADFKIATATTLQFIPDAVESGHDAKIAMWQWLDKESKLTFTSAGQHYNGHCALAPSGQ